MVEHLTLLIDQVEPLGSVIDISAQPAPERPRDQRRLAPSLRKPFRAFRLVGFVESGIQRDGLYVELLEEPGKNQRGTPVVEVDQHLELRAAEGLDIDPLQQAVDIGIDGIAGIGDVTHLVGMDPADVLAEEHVL